jgi:hypothetical protein
VLKYRKINYFRSEVMASKRKAGGVVATKEPQIADSEDEALGDLDLDKYAVVITFFLSLFCNNYPYILIVFCVYRAGDLMFFMEFFCSLQLQGSRGAYPALIFSS